MLKGKTENGFEFEIDPEVLETWEFVDTVAKMTSKDEMVQLTATHRYIEIVIGSNMDNLNKFLEEKTGKPAMFVDVLNTAQQIVNANKELKNLSTLQNV